MSKTISLVLNRVTKKNLVLKIVMKFIWIIFMKIFLLQYYNHLQFKILFYNIIITYNNSISNQLYILLVFEFNQPFFGTQPFLFYKIKNQYNN